MASEKNQFGLKRQIPAKVKREVRQRSKFGCVVCRNAIYQYEHILPEFKDAKEHSADRIALLCPTCHTNVTKGRIPKEVVQRKYEQIQREERTAPPRDTEYFVNHYQNLQVKIGASRFIEHQSIINIDGADVLSYRKDKFTGRYLVTGIFFDQKGSKLFEIIDNEWIGSTDIWDVEQEGRRLVIKSGLRNVVFDAIKNEENSTLKINRLNMHVPPFHIIVNQERLIVRQSAIDYSKAIDVEIEGDFTHGDCAIYLDSSQTKKPEQGQLQIVGGKGVWLDGTGIWFGFGNISALIYKVALWNHGCDVRSVSKVKKSIVPLADQNYFVIGELETRIRKYPKWNEELYFLNGQQLDSKPYSWGVIDSDEHNHTELFHISRQESADLALNEGFIGFYADDVIEQEWSDKVFEVEVKTEDEFGNTFAQRVKVSNINGREVIRRTNPQTQKLFHPQEFAGTCPWRKNRD
ncbi:HNH endonuclease [Pseudidiomarina terrestris]|uniref:HNH endonuclease n=1 Tax=Pseudidiomarina terrestris TaxID=2820060 RepID=UPI002656A4F8|nr:hypothetical protein [Pseudidiomarina sp. 1ASP75-5]MDN7134916.1 hypothetical protein [Pseudidiomarina sp. 1ASP75-5]